MVEPQWMVEIYMLYLMAKNCDEEAAQLPIEGIKVILNQMIQESEWSKQLYRENFAEVYAENCRVCDTFLITGHMAALGLFDCYHVPLMEIEDLKNRTKKIIVESAYHSEIEKKQYLSMISMEMVEHSDGKGCYIATAVYGSYDCAQVWTLRRFRDCYLEKRLWGKAFIKIYYRISPMLVVRYGKRTHVIVLVKKVLDNFVAFLNKRGYSNERYTE